MSASTSSLAKKRGAYEHRTNDYEVCSDSFDIIESEIIGF